MLTLCAAHQQGVRIMSSPAPAPLIIRKRTSRSSTPLPISRLSPSVRLRAAVMSTIVEEGHFGRLFTRYGIHVECGSQHWCVHRRYSEFVKLFDALTLHANLPKLCLRHGNGIEPALVSERVKMLHELLQRLLERWQFHSILNEFLGVPLHLCAPAALPQCPKPQATNAESAASNSQSVFLQECLPKSPRRESPSRIFDLAIALPLRKSDASMALSRANDVMNYEQIAEAFAASAFEALALTDQGSLSRAMVGRFTRHVLSVGIQLAHIVCATAYLGRLQALPRSAIAHDRWQLVLFVLLRLAVQTYSDQGEQTLWAFNPHSRLRAGWPQCTIPSLREIERVVLASLDHRTLCTEAEFAASSSTLELYCSL